MIDERAVAGTFQLDGGVIHAIITYNSISGGAPYRTVCGSHFDIAVLAEVGTTDISEITCKRCLRKLGADNGQLHRPKVSDYLDRPVKLVGTHFDRSSGHRHAMASSHDCVAPICGTIFPDNTYPYVPLLPNNTKGRDKMLSGITCKHCLELLRSGGIIMPKNNSVKLMGTYAYDRRRADCPVHALVKREPRESDNPVVGIPALSSVCGAYYPDIYRSDEDKAYPDTNEKIMAKVTCQECLAKLKLLGMLPSPKQDKKFFLVTYNNGSMGIFSLIAEMKNEIKDRGDQISNIRLINSYDVISMKTTMVNESGKEITEENLL